MDDETQAFSFDSLLNGKLGVSARYGSFLAEAASYCLQFKRHRSPVRLLLSGDVVTLGMLGWVESDGNLSSTYTDLQEATEYGAYGVAIVVAVNLTQIPWVERSAKGTGVDYWLSAGVDERGLFQHAARLEVSGILDGDESAISKRLRKKLIQTERTDQTCLPAYVAIVEFGAPETRLVKRANSETEP